MCRLSGICGARGLTAKQGSSWGLRWGVAEFLMLYKQFGGSSAPPARPLGLHPQVAQISQTETPPRQLGLHPQIAQVSPAEATEPGVTVN